MCKTPSLEDKLTPLSELQKDPTTPEARKERAECLTAKISLLVAKAAKIVGDAHSEFILHC